MSNLPELPRIAPHERLLSRPSWCDASLMTYANEATFTVVSVGAGPVRILSNANPKRWAIGFTRVAGSPVDTRVANNNNPDVYGSLITDDVRQSWWTIFAYGPMIQLEWYISAPFAIQVGIWEIEIGELENEN